MAEFCQGWPRRSWTPLLRRGPPCSIATEGRFGRSDATQAPSDPAVQRRQLVRLAEAEVGGPSPQVWDQLADHPFQADAPVPPRQLANPIFEPGHGLVGDAPPERRIVLDCKAEERPVPGAGDGTLLRVDLQFEAPFDEAGQARHDPSASLFAAD